MTISKKAARSSDPVTHYAQSVVAGRAIACKLVVKACQRHLDDIDHAAERGLVWRPDIARHKLRFFPDYLRHSKGELAGKPLTLEPWEEFCIGSLFGWFRVGGLRRFKTGYLEIAKKNGKSTIGAGIGLIGLVADFEPGAEVYATATKRDQARIVFSEAQRMVKASPALSKSVSNRTLNLAVEETGSKFEPLSSDEKTADGLNPSMVIVDELHRHKSRALRNLMESGQVSRRQPMMVIITTAGDENPTSAYAVEHDYAIKILDRVFPRDDYFTFITTIDDRDKWDDPKELAKANPNLGVSVKLSALMELVAKAQELPADKADFLRYHCNVRQSDATKYIDMDLWRANGGPPFDPAGLAGRVCYAGLDLSSRIDLSSLVLLFPPIAGEILWRVLPYFWMPADTIPRREKEDRVPFARWVEMHWIEATPGNVIDYKEIENAVLEARALYDLRSLAYDPWNATQLATNLQDAGVPVFEFVQGLRSYTAPTKELEVMLLQKKLDHGGNEVLGWNASNLAVQRDKNENRMPHKTHSTGRIDGMTALIMAIGRSMADDTGPSIYDTLARQG